ncbi:fimbria/pilus outer membrane usher protein [Novosphingobium sp. Leaf2]|uniref:fimbria/pilus outer membrane usher protein n=1 Tax=Novosphingobium sp. Leaf2 TaxID=1735670 RepID=UPI0006F9C6AD|nr:fimbria/pilus outer membrane usher protein [Novosphingobium sp. Leaf2]KQM18905.1 pilus assembly protein PapC [Novosphingobium sp. Leaf2]
MIRAVFVPVRAAIAAALLGLLFCAPAALHGQDSVAAVDGPVPVGIIVNGQAMPDPGLLIVRKGRVLARRTDVEAWGLSVRSAAEETVAGESYVALDTMSGLVARLEDDGATLRIEADLALFPHMHVQPGYRVVPVAPAIPAQFVDYDLTLGTWDGITRITGLVDTGVSGRWGVAGTSVLVDTARGGLTRLDTALRRDFPDRRVRLVLGDSVGRGAPWSRPVRYGGIFLGTDFSLDPQSINFPLPTVSGSALVPSTVELIAQSSRQSYELGPGRFDLALQPQLTGAGAVTMSVRDVTGQTRQVTRSFYTSIDLLRPGLSQFAFEAGALRRGFGYRSFAYGPLFAAAGLHRGLTSTLTMETRAELSADTRMAGLGAVLVVAPLGQVSVAGAVSQGHAGTGALVHAQAQRITARYTLSASYERADARFRQVGEPRINGGARSELAVAGGLSLGWIGSVNASYARLAQGRGSAGATRFDLASAYYTTSIRSAFASIGVQYTRSRDVSARGRSAGIFGNLTMPLGPRSQVAALAEPGRGALAYNQNLPDGTGSGMRALAGYDRGAQWLEGGVSYRTQAGDIRLDGWRRQGGNGVQLNARGGVLRIDRAVLATQHVDDGFALVEVDADAPVTVTVENRQRPRKAGQGRRVIVTGLQPYAENHIGVDAADVPITADLPTAVQTIAPGWRQAARVRFGGATRQGLRLRLVDSASAGLPAGSAVTWPGGATVVGYDGEVWIEDLPATLVVLHVTGSAGACDVTLPQGLHNPGPGASMPVTCTPALSERPKP